MQATESAYNLEALLQNESKLKGSLRYNFRKELKAKDPATRLDWMKGVARQEKHMLDRARNMQSRVISNTHSHS